MRGSGLVAEKWTSPRPARERLPRFCYFFFQAEFIS